MKKVILSVLLAAGLSFNASAIFFGSGGGLLAAVGLVASGGSVGYTIKAIFTGSQKDWAYAAKLGLAGLIILEEEGQIEFGPVHGELKGITAEQIAIYNSEIEEANLVFEEVSSQIGSNTSVDDVKQIWKDYESVVSPETIEVMRAIVAE